MANLSFPAHGQMDYGPNEEYVEQSRGTGGGGAGVFVPAEKTNIQQIAVVDGSALGWFDQPVLHSSAPPFRIANNGVQVRTALQTFLDALSSTGRPGVLAPGTYLVNGGLDIKSNTTLSAYGATIINTDSGNLYTPVVRGWDVDNITIYGLTIDAAKSIVTDYTQWKHALQFTGCDRVAVIDCTFKNAKGDGLIFDDDNNAGLLHNTNARVSGVLCTGNMRQGLTISDLTHGSFHGSVFTLTEGQAPQSGLDIEPNGPNSRIADIQFFGCEFSHNASSGLATMMHANGQGEASFYGCSFTFNNNGAILFDSGRMEFYGCIFDNNVASGVALTPDSARFKLVEDIKFIGGYMRNNGGRAINAAVGDGVTLRRVLVDGVSIYGNSKTTPYALSAIEISGGATGVVDDFTVTNCRIGNGGFTTTHAFGLSTNAQVTNFRLTNTHFLGNQYGGVNLADAVASRTIYGNNGVVSSKSGVLWLKDGDTITHGIQGTPRKYGVNPLVAGHVASLNTVNGTTMKLSLRDATGTAVTAVEEVLWWAEM